MLSSAIRRRISRSQMRSNLQCPHCGASLPATRDAFCPECFQGLDEPTAAELAAERAAKGQKESPGRAKAGRVGAAIGVAVGVLGTLAHLADAPRDVAGALGAITGFALIAGPLSLVSSNFLLPTSSCPRSATASFARLLE
jgi:hypothetical protein